MSPDELRAYLKGSGTKAGKHKTPKISGPMSSAYFRRHFVDQEEHGLQARGVKWFRWLYPQLLIYAIPNGGKRDKVEAARLKAEGVEEGIPDLHVPVAAGEFHSLYIETKTQDGTLSPAQIIKHPLLRALGHCVIVPRTFEEFQSGINDYLNQK